MKVLVACEFSGIVRDAFIAKGHDALSCDLLPSERGNQYHYQGDARDIINDDWDLMIAHPPCTHLAVSGARWFKDKQVEQKEALDFVRLLMDAPIDKICIENPISIISSHIRKPDQIVQPWMFGHEQTKTTCLWLKNLPLLLPTHIVSKGERHITKSGKSLPEWYNIPPSKDRWKIRSRTFQGIGNAMADQWG
jgi:site-specific DNA-cytosine methylase